MAIDRKKLKAMAAKHRDRIKGGKADKAQPYDFDPKELAMGIEVEAEHTGDPQTAMEIAMDHLKEFPDYYTRLKRMERAAEKAKSKNEDKIPLDKQKKIQKFLLRRPVKDDEKFHSFVQGMGLEPDDAEPVAYKLAYKLGKGKKAKKESTMDISWSLSWLEQLQEAMMEAEADSAARMASHLAGGGDPESVHDVKRSMRQMKIMARHREAERVARSGTSRLAAQGVGSGAKKKLKAMSPRQESVTALDIMRARYQAFMEAATPPPIPADARRRVKKQKFTGAKRKAGGIQPGSDLAQQLATVAKQSGETAARQRIQKSVSASPGMRSVTATGKTSGYLPGSSPRSDKPERWRKRLNQSADLFGPVIAEFRSIFEEVSPKEMERKLKIARRAAEKRAKKAAHPGLMKKSGDIRQASVPRYLMKPSDRVYAIHKKSA